ncbi:MAG: hypothetical protein Q7T54_03395, partial [Candidatus Levybacteria bacterium]|nr:hypothetical protein [Candidatus Levybacteria bacterium]
MDQAKKFLRFFLGVPLTLLSFLFIFKILLDNKDDIGHSIEKLDPLLFVLGILFFSLFFFVKSFIWIGILKKRGFTPEIRRTIYNYNLSEVKRYIPGSIFAFVGRVGSHSESVPKKETLKAIGIEIVLLILSAGFISIPALKFTLLKTPLSNSFHPQLLIVTSFLL